MLRLFIAVTLAVLSLCGTAFYLIALWSAYLFRREKPPRSDRANALPVSILKPLRGADAGTDAALRSHCEQDYRAYEIIFGVNSSEDDAAPLVHKLIAEYPHLNIRLLVCSERLGSNRKVSNLIHLAQVAQYRHLLVNDGDIKVAPGYLRAVMERFGDPRVGMVTCLYRGRASSTLASRMESLGIASDFVPGVLAARYLDDNLTFGLGSTLAMSRDALDRVGGFSAVVDYLADDYQLGARISAAGFKIALAQEVVETSIPAYSFRQFWEHQIRWARTMRMSRPGGYRGLVLTFALPWAILLAIAAPHQWWAWTVLSFALLARLAAAVRIGLETLDDRQVLPNLWVLPIRDFLALAIWSWSYAGNTVMWRGEKFRIEGGRMHPIIASSSEPAPSKMPPETQRR